jgi:hypothetical protein
MARKTFDGVKVRDMTPKEEAEFNAAVAAGLKEMVVPVTITRLQFFKQVWKMGTINAQAAKDAIAKKALPTQFNTFLAALPAADRDSAEMDLLAADTFHRDNPLVGAIQQANSWTDQQVDQLWIEAAKL